MHEKLVWRLRHCSTSETPCKTCDWAECNECLDRIMLEAADAIEELQLYVDLYKDLTEKGEKVSREVIDKYPKWIPVSERLPELHEEVLVCNEEYGLSGLGFATVAVWDGTDWIETWDRRAAIHCVSHWMLLPTAPKEE